MSRVKIDKQHVVIERLRQRTGTLGVVRLLTLPQIEKILQDAECVYDRVSVEFERVYETIYDCIVGRLVTAN